MSDDATRGSDFAHVDPVRVRRATAADVEAIAAVHLSSWRVAYRDDAPPGWLGAQTLQGRIDAWGERLGDEARAAGTTVHVALVPADGDVVGFCSVSAPSRDSDADEDTAEIAALYVDPGAWRVGAGRALVAAATDALTAAGWETVTLWVLQTNDRARAFYRAQGFADDGGRLIQGDWTPQLRMRRALA